MIIKKTSICLCALTIQFTAASVFAEEVDASKQRSWYLGGGLGITELDPDTNNTGYSVADERDQGFKLFAGYDFGERLTVEGFYADLGSAKISSSFPSQPDGEIDYSTMGASALWYFWRNGEAKGENLRKGLQAYAQGGLSFINNSATVNYTQENSFQVQYGAGLEYGLNNGVALRAGIDLYDKDAGMVFVGVLKRFGTKSKRKIITEPVPEQVVEPVPEPVVEPAPSPEILVPVVVVVHDADNDGVIDADDQCAASPENIEVDDKGCSDIFAEIGDVNFEPKSYELTERSKVILDEAIITISASPELHIEVQAHTDYKGSGESNLELSEQRALSVKAYLVSKGVNESQLTAKGYGESQPIADNKTAEGRAKNRRVELEVVKDDVKELDVDESQPDDVVDPVTDNPEIEGSNDPVNEKVETADDTVADEKQTEPEEVVRTEGENSEPADTVEIEEEISEADVKQ